MCVCVCWGGWVNVKVKGVHGGQKKDVRLSLARVTGSH